LGAFTVPLGVAEQRTHGNGGRLDVIIATVNMMLLLLLLLVTRCLAQMTLPFPPLAGCGRFPTGRKLDLHGWRRRRRGRRVIIVIIMTRRHVVLATRAAK